MLYKIRIDDFDKTEWEKHAKEFSDYNLYQTWPYQQVRADMENWSINRVIICDDNDVPVMLCQIRIKTLPLVNFKVGYIQSGPIFKKINRDFNSENFSAAFDLLRKTYLPYKINVLRIMPQILNSEGNFFYDLFNSCGFSKIKNAKPYNTLTIAVDIPEEEMRSRLHSGWRKYLKRAEQKGIEIKEGTDIEYLMILKNLYNGAISRKKFDGLDPEIFSQTQRMLPEDEKINTVVAFYEGKPVTAHATSHLGNVALGVLAGSSEKGLECGASYLVWWRTLLAAKRSGMKIYDLAGYDKEKNHSVYQFKMRMGAIEDYSIGTYEAYSNTFSRFLWRLMDKFITLLNRK